MSRQWMGPTLIATVLLGGITMPATEPSAAAGPGSVPRWRSEEGMTAEQINRQRAQQERMRLQAWEHRMRMQELRARRPRVYIAPQPWSYGYDRFYPYYPQQPWGPAFPGQFQSFPGNYYFGY